MPAGSPTWVGHVQKAHGLNGRLLVHLDDGIAGAQWPKRLEFVWLETRGQKVPYRCLEFQFKVPGGLLLHLEGLDRPEQVGPLLKSRVGFEGLILKVVSSGAAWGFDESDLPGSTLVDRSSGLRAPLVQLHRRPPQDFLEFSVNGTPVFLPLVQDLVHRWNPSERELEVSLPEGLLDLYLSESNENPAPSHED
jgi:16S rRNA processing protein RimM